MPRELAQRLLLLSSSTLAQPYTLNDTITDKIGVGFCYFLEGTIIT